MLIDNLTIADMNFSLFVRGLWCLIVVWSPSQFGVLCDFQISLNPRVGCEEYVECAQALELNGYQVLFECGHGRYWYLGDRVLPQVQHLYPPTTILVPPCPSIRLADLLTNEEIARVWIGHVILRIPRSYSKFIQTQLKVCLADIPVASVFPFPPKVKFSSCMFILHILAL